MKKLLIIMLGVILLTASVLANDVALDDFECGGMSCGTGWNNVWQYTGSCEVGTFSNPIGTYHLRGTSSCDTTRNLDTSGYDQVNITFYATAGSLESSEQCRYYYFDGTTNHLLLTLSNGDDDNNHDYYEFDITSYGFNTNAGVRMATSFGSGGDYCYLDNVQVVGAGTIALNLFTEDSYLIGEQNVLIEGTSSATSQQHTFELYDQSDVLFCSDTVVSPAVPNTPFSTVCDMPNITQTNAYAILYLTSDLSITITKYFDVTQAQQDNTKLDIQKIYFSPQVLQGGNIEIYSVLKVGNNVSVDRITNTVRFPDGTSRVFGMEETFNPNEYKSFVSDTYQTGTVYFTVRAEGGIYFDVYTNQYNVLPFSIEYVANVGNVETVDKINQPKVESVGGTEYSADEAARVVLHILDNNGIPLYNASCIITVRDSFNKVIVDNGALEYINQSNGLYSYQFATNIPYGVYSVDSECDLNGSIIYVADTFHVAQWTEGISNKVVGYSVKRVSGTEYQINDTAYIVVQLLRDDVPENDAVCSIDVYSPSTTPGEIYTKTISSANMPLLNTSNGLYRYEFNETYYDGLYLADMVCTDEVSGAFPIDYKNGIVNTTISSTPEYINGSELNITLANQVPIVALMTIEGVSDTDSSIANWYLDIGGSNTSISRDMNNDEAGNIFLINLYDNASVGTHTIKAYHDIDSGATLTTTANMVAFGLEDGYNTIPYCYVSIDNDTTVSVALEDIDNLECNIDITQSSDLLIFMVFSGKVANNGAEIGYTVSIDAVDYEMSSRGYTAANVYGTISFITLTNTQLSPGSHNIRGRWNVDVGTATAQNVKLLVIANEAGPRYFSAKKTLITTTSTTSSVPIDIGVDTATTLYSNAHLLSFLNMDVDSGSGNRDSYFLINTDGENGETFSRYFPSANKEGSVTVLETSDELGIGYYSSKGRWYTESPNVLTGHQIKLITLAFTTESYISPTYLASDFHVSDLENSIVNRTPEAIWSYYNRTLTYYEDTTNYTLITQGVWQYNNKTLTFAQDTHVGGTEYDIEEGVGKIVVRMTDVTGDPVTGADCHIGIFTPDNQPYIWNDTMIEHVSTTGKHNGIYVYDFNLSNQTGVHPYGVDCVQGGKDYFMMDTFHVRDIASEVWTQFDNRTLTNATNIAPDIWGGNYTINSGLLAQIVSGVWDYVARYIHGVIN